MRQVVLDTETTGLDPEEGHRILEIGCVELVNRRLTGNNLHLFINPERDIDAGALDVHGITLEQLQHKPVFAAIVDEFLEYIEGAELIIHNAPFDVGFLNHELALLGETFGCIEDRCSVTDTLRLARNKYPGQRISLDALCNRLNIDNSQRTLHGALLDAELLADVYLVMTGGQSALFGGDGLGAEEDEPVRRVSADRERLPVLRATEEELATHRQVLERVSKAFGHPSFWEMMERGEDWRRVLENPEVD